MKKYILLFLLFTMIKISKTQSLISETVQINPEKIISTKVAMTSQKGGLVFFQPFDSNTAFIISHGSSENESFENQEIDSIKLEKSKQKINSISGQGNEETHSGSRVQNISLGRNFAGNLGGGCPNDNTMAISKTGNIISGENSDFYYYNENGTLLGFAYMTTIFLSVSNGVTNMCDPKVLYDNVENRFIIYTQTCDAIAANSRVLIAVSKDDNPLHGFFTYWFTGNPLNDNSYFDYPKMAIYNNEILVTGNLYSQGGGYNQSVIYQINKTKMYAGLSTTSQCWSGIANTPFTLVPLGFGRDGLVGPPYNLVATESTANGNTLNYYQLTDEITATNEVINSFTVNTPNYSLPANSIQASGSNNLDVGDCRGMDGFYLNGYAHFVHIFDQNGWSGIRYNRIRISTLIDSTYDISAQGTKDYVYPSLCSFGSSNTDQSVLIGFMANSATTFPEMRVKPIDNYMISSNSIQLKAGESAIRGCYNSSKNKIRWGDYTGICRKPFSNPQTAWMSGSYGSTSGVWKTWIAEINGSGSNLGIPESAHKNEATYFPNPTRGSVFIKLNLPSGDKYKIQITNAEGKLADTQELGFLNEGEHTLTYFKKLTSGIYQVSILNNQNKSISNESIFFGN